MVEADGNQGIDEDGDEQTDDPVHVPLRLFVNLVWIVFLRHHLIHRLPFLPKVTYDAEIGVATVHEDAGLYVVVALLCIVVHVFQALLRHVIVVDVVLRLLGVFLQGALYAGG